MRILSRCSDIIVANINVLLDKAENPEAMIAQVIREMEDELAMARSHAASAIAAERRLNRELAEQRVGIEFWRTKARAAVAANRDDLARLALARKKELEISAAELATQHAAALETSTQVRASLHALETNLAVARAQATFIDRPLIAPPSASGARPRRRQAPGLGLRRRRQIAALGAAADRPGRRHRRRNGSSRPRRRGNDLCRVGNRGRTRPRVGRIEGRERPAIGFANSRNPAWKSEEAILISPCPWEDDLAAVTSPSVAPLRLCR